MKLNNHGDRCEALARSAHRRDLEAKAKRPARERRRDPKRA
jgi:hypothetical protein